VLLKRLVTSVYFSPHRCTGGQKFGALVTRNKFF